MTGFGEIHLHGFGAELVIERKVCGDFGGGVNG
jgi:hypothetical protein